MPASLIRRSIAPRSRAAEAARGGPLEASRVLAIGDALRTDIAGAAREGLDALFISAGIHHDEVHGGGPRAEADRLTELFQREKLWPVATARALRP